MPPTILRPSVPTPLDFVKQDISPYFTGATREEQRIVERLLKHGESPEAIREFCRCRNKLGDYVYWFALAVLWVNYTGWSELALWKKMFSAERPNRAECLMKPSEYSLLADMPDEFIVFRAHRPGEEDWIAYTLSLEIAARFAKERGVAEVSAYQVRRADVLALFLRRGEMEVLVLDKSLVRLHGRAEIIHSEEAPQGEANDLKGEPNAHCDTEREAATPAE